LENLVKMVTPARLRQPLPDNERAKWLRIPKELWRLVDWLFKNALEVEDLFLESGDSYEMDQLREALDTGSELPKVFSHSVAETLLRLLESLEVPIIPFTFYRNVLEVQSAAMAKQLVAKLPDIHYNTFFYVISFLRELLTRREKNKLTPESLAVVFSTVLIRPPKGVKQSDQAHKQQAACIELFLHTDELTISLPAPAPANPPASSGSAPTAGTSSTSTGYASSSTPSNTSQSSTTPVSVSNAPILGGSRQAAQSQPVPATSSSYGASSGNSSSSSYTSIQRGASTSATPSSTGGWRSSTPSQ
jgi:hypothetical protein